MKTLSARPSNLLEALYCAVPGGVEVLQSFLAVGGPHRHCSRNAFASRRSAASNPTELPIHHGLELLQQVDVLVWKGAGSAAGLAQHVRGA